VLPVALLLALLYALTQHARHHEITAMRAAGISLWRLCLPYFGIGLMATGAQFALNELVVPRSAAWAQHIRTRYVQTAEDLREQTKARHFGMINERAHRHWFCNQYDAHAAEMFGPTVVWTLPDGSLRTLNAARAVHTNGGWTFFNATVTAQADPDVPVMQKLLQTNVLAMPEFDETPGQILGEIKMGNPETFNPHTEDISLRDMLDYLRAHPGLPKEQVGGLLTRFHNRLAAPWTCLVVVLIAIPFGAGSGRRNLFFGVAGSIFIVAGYLVAQQVSLAVGSHGHLPAWLAAWLPNLLFAAAGGVLTARVR